MQEIKILSVASSVFIRSCSEGVLKDAPCVAIAPTPSGTVSHKETLGPTISSGIHFRATQLSLRVLKSCVGLLRTRTVAKIYPTYDIRISENTVDNHRTRCFAHSNR